MRFLGKVKRVLNCIREGNMVLEEVRVSSNRTLQLFPGSWRKEPDYDKGWLWHLAAHSKVIYDIGANMGQSAVLAMLTGSVEKMILVDPNPKALSIAAMNMIFNDWINKVQLYLAFVGDADDKNVKFWTVGSGAAGSMFPDHAKTASQQGKAMEVKTITLDTIAKNIGFGPDLLKIDVEGAESLVLEGALNLVSEYHPRIMVEMHSNKDLPMLENARKILDWCSRTNYRAWYLKEHKEMRSPEDIAHRGRCHLLLLPVEEEYPSYLKGVSQGEPAPILREKR